jgi:hypothetical protein
MSAAAAAAAAVGVDLPSTYFMACVTFRTFVVALGSRYLLQSNYESETRMPIAAAFGAIGLGFIVAFWRKSTVGPVFGERIWWHHMRLFHAATYLAASYMVANKEVASLNALTSLLLFDVMVGITAKIVNKENGNK